MTCPERYVCPAPYFPQEEEDDSIFPAALFVQKALAGRN